MKNEKSVDKEWLQRQAKRLETKLLKEHGKSPHWISMLPRFNNCIQTTFIGENTVEIDYDKYKKIRNQFIKEAYDITARKYVGISIKHSYHDESKYPTLWGKERTEDNEERCFSGYTYNIDKCELYSIEDFQEYGKRIYMMKFEPVKMCANYKKKYKKYDTVLVNIEEVRQFLETLREE